MDPWPWVMLDRGQLGEPERKCQLDRAHAILAAIMSPTPSMIAAGEGRLRYTRGRLKPERIQVENVWDGMIRAALDEAAGEGK